MELSPAVRSIILKMQKNECTEHIIYHNLAAAITNEADSETLERLGNEEYQHCQLWQEYTGIEVEPDMGKIRLYKLLAKLFGYTFILKLMESGETIAADTYQQLVREVPEAQKISEDEDQHEQALLDILDEERLKYVGSMVLGLNDALVELTGTLAGLTLAMENTRLIAMAGLITGISATLSMASSEYLSARSDGREDALKSCTYTGIAYCLTVALLVMPYLVFPDDKYLFALGTMLVIVIGIILFFNYYISVAKNLNFWHRFKEMACISLGVAAFSFVIGLFVKNVLGIDM